MKSSDYQEILIYVVHITHFYGANLKKKKVEGGIIEREIRDIPVSMVQIPHSYKTSDSDSTNKYF